jgi:membrane protein implicated in regulation of membrane protease activity
MRFQWPELADASAPRRWFWQLVVPQDEHLWSSDSLLSSANRWQREGIIWRREAVQSQASLEEWTEATSQPPIPPGVHCYLFSSFDPAGTFGIRTCSRRTLVYGFSFLALAIACAWTYLPILRHPIATMACGALLAATAWRYSEQAALVAQASVLGLALAAVPAFVRRWGGTAESAGRRSAAGRGTDGRLVDSRPPELRSTDVHRPDSQRIDARRADSHRGEALPSDPVSNGSHRHVAQELQRTAQDGSAPPTTIRTPGPREPQTPMHAADGPAADHPAPDTSAPGVPESRP